MIRASTKGGVEPGSFGWQGQGLESATAESAQFGRVRNLESATAESRPTRPVGKYTEHHDPTPAAPVTRMPTAAAPAAPVQTGGPAPDTPYEARARAGQALGPPPSRGGGQAAAGGGGGGAGNFLAKQAGKQVAKQGIKQVLGRGAASAGGSAGPGLLTSAGAGIALGAAFYHDVSGAAEHRSNLQNGTATGFDIAKSAVGALNPVTGPAQNLMNIPGAGKALELGKEGVSSVLGFFNPFD